MQAPFSRTSYSLLREKSEKAPDRPAVLTADGSITYAALVERAERIAGALHARGIRRGDRVGVLGLNSIAWLEIFFGASALGAAVVPFSTYSTRAELDYQLQDSVVRCIFTQEHIGAHDFAADFLALQASHPELERVILIDAAARSGVEALRDYLQGDRLAPMAPGLGASPTDIMLIHYTSGSSSRPKAVPLQHWAVIENTFNIGERQGLQPTDRVFLPSPLFWAYGAVNALHATLSHGATLVLQEKFDAGGALDLIEQHKCTSIYTLPAMINSMLAHPAFDKRRTASLRTGATIGSPQDIVRAAEEFGCPQICNIYGSTEGCGNSCVTPHDWPLERRAACQGPPLPGNRFRIRDGESGQILGTGAVGQLEIAGYLTPGYCGMSVQHNATTFTEDGWFRTGDLGHLLADGSFVFAARHSEMIKRSGINVSPVEVEEAIQQHPDVALAAVTGLEDTARGEIIVAYVVPRQGARPTKDALIAHCRTRLSSYKLPDRIHFTEALPLTVTGKLMRRELRAKAARET